MTTAPRTSHCAAVATVDNRTFVCVAPPHPTEPKNHYYSAQQSSVPSNAGLESNIEEYFRQEVRKLGGISVKLAPTTKGIPDRLIALGGKLHLVELKQEGGQLSSAQVFQHQRFRRQGIVVAVLEGKMQVRAWINAQIDAAGPQD